MRKRIIFAAMLATGSLLAGALSANAGAYNFTQIDVPFTGASDTTIFGINGLGGIVGSYRDVAFQLHGFFRDAGGNFVSVDVPFPNASNTTAYGLNNQSQIVGSYNIGAFQNLHGFVLDGGRFAAIDVPFANASQTQPFGINGEGQEPR
jgi:hypothetical protein